MTTKARSFLPAFLGLLAIPVLLCQCASPGGTATAGSGNLFMDSADGTTAGYGSPAQPEAFGVAKSRAEFSPSAERSRSGLGTRWGETRSSHVDGTEFVRASSRPDATLAIRYNDAAGLPGGSRSASQPFSAGGIASVGIKSGGRYLKARRAYSSQDPRVIGEHGDRYSIDVKNQTGERIEVVLSVDGLDVLDGSSASTGKRGYVIAPHGRLSVEGFRRSYESVAAFRFGSVDSSYAARSTGSTRNVGVIGAAVFREKGDSDWQTRKHADPFPGERGSGEFAIPPSWR